MWRSQLFWQLFGASSGLLLLVIVLLTAVALHNLEQCNAPAPLQQGLVLVAVLITLPAVLGAWFLARRITRPLQELTAGAEQIEAGAYGHRIYTDGSDELGILARTFNRTSERLASQYQQMHEDRDQLHAVLSSMVEGVIAIDQDQRILFANDRATQLLEFQVRSPVGRKLWEVVRHRAFQDIVSVVLQEARSLHHNLDWTGVAVKSLAIHAGPLAGSPPRGAVLVLHDTTELRRLEKLRQEFVANVSHELKTPLAVIKACVETLIDGAAEDPNHRGRFLEQIATHAERLHNLILDLLSLAQIEGGTETFVFAPVSLGQVAAACLERRQPLAAGKQQNLHLVAPAVDGATAWADEEAVQQILDNLIDNAIKYTPEGGRIAVRWWCEQEETCLEVEDTGLGIAEQDLPRIFERFYRVDKARSRELGGTGLGLSIVKHLTQAMQGSVQARSQLGQGSTFTVRLPRARE